MIHGKPEKLLSSKPYLAGSLLSYWRTMIFNGFHNWDLMGLDGIQWE